MLSIPIVHPPGQTTVEAVVAAEVAVLVLTVPVPVVAAVEAVEAITSGVLEARDRKSVV